MTCRELLLEQDPVLDPFPPDDGGEGAIVDPDSTDVPMPPEPVLE